ncbi:methyl-accepting chemotaxis protein [Natrinema salaciae]|uniref:Methyl-accepting chemotaxis protein n=1 Tax=Natrinema salaciae TaxID=1186196 RepID=A0A1H9BVA1_9EURY|nr:methyl-accepting chemotaxis protein [Natrinema salaciae]SEP92681.1 methyl-accepting chemotaxis protein [Natrinema salaciae]
MVGTVRQLVPSIIRRSYALKFGIVLLVLGITVGSLGLVATAALTDSVEATVLEDQQDAAVQEAQAIDSWDQRNAQLVASAANAPVFGSGNESAIEAYLQETYQSFPNGRMNAIYVNTSTGEIQGSVDTNAATIEDLSFPNRDELDEDLSSHNIQRTEPYAMPDESGLAFDSHAVVSYYVGVGDADDRALVITFNLYDRSTEMLSSTDSETVVTVVDGQGRIVGDDAYLGYEDGQEAVTFFEPYDDRNGLLKAAREGPGATKIDGEPPGVLNTEPYNFDPDGYVVGYHTTADGWVVLVHTTNADALGFVNTVDRFGTAVTLGVVLLIGLFGAVLGRNTAISIDRLTRAVGEMEDGNLDVEVESERIDNIGRLYDGFTSMRDELKRKITETEDARATAERERERVERINEDLQQAAASYCDVMEAAADGDLTARMDPDASENETMRAIATDFNEMLTELEGTVENISRFATEVATASEQVTASSEEVRSASEQVSASIQEISNGADDQYESLRSVDAEMNTLSTTTEEIAATSNEVADVAERTARTSREGHDAAQAAIDACEHLETERDAVVEEFEQLRNEVGQIDELTDSIAEIAEQTNMLALNANIEASRSASAEDDGGFAAVAAEVKELSQDVKDATDEIGARLERIQDQTEQSADEVDRTSREIERVHDLVTDTVASLEEIAEYAQETNDGVQAISTATEEQAGSTQEVVAMVDDIATIAEETTAEAETVAASAEEQTSALTAVSRSADDLSQQAVTLSEALDRFETDADGSAGPVDSLAAIPDPGTGSDGSTPDDGERSEPDHDGERSEPNQDGERNEPDDAAFTFGQEPATPDDTPDSTEDS